MRTPALEYIKWIDNEHIEFLIYQNCKTLSGVFKCNFKYLKHFSQSDLNLIKNATFINKKFNYSYIQEYNKNEILIYLDPPYLFNAVGAYNEFNMDDIYENIENVILNDYNFIFVHSSHFLINRLFKIYICKKYNKLYGKSKKKNEHVIYSNLNYIQWNILK